jgi:2-aminomuconate deaminase
MLEYGVNGLAHILPDRAQALAHYPHMREAGGLLFVSGISSRRPDNSVEGIGDIRIQARAVIENIRTILMAAGADLGHLVDVTAFLVDMTDYAGYNEVYNEYFSAETGPARTTVAVKSLPGPDLLIEIKAVALAPDRRSA